MSVIRFTQVTLRLVLIIMNRLADPRTVNSGSKLDKSELSAVETSEPFVLIINYIGHPRK